MEPLPKIPSPPGQLLREFCVRALPLLVFAAGCAGVIGLWRVQGLGRSLTGVGEGLRSGVLSPQPGMVTRLLVDPYVRVRRGDPIAEIEPYDPRAKLEWLRARLDLARLAVTPSLEQRNVVDVERLRVELLRARSDLAIARVRLAFAEREVARHEPLYRDRLVAEDAYELSLGTREIHATEVAELSRAVESMEIRLAEISTPETVPTPSALAELTALHESDTNRLAPVTLVAPIDGVVGAFLRQPGEFVLEGELLTAVQSERAERIVGYLRQPFAFEPSPGMPVSVRQRDGKRHRFSSEIRQVGPQFETMTNALALVREGLLVDAALPIYIDIPPEIHLRPGEVVDLLLPSPPRSGATLAHTPAHPPAPQP
ncbi:MAG: hypothetical protein IT580_14130 [Verrucomicrobiales bacterium]|nr:hypothetical protein [Verrucomicrobiales bacterium]